MLKEHGVDEVVLAVNYLADSLRASVGEEYKGLRIRYSPEDKPLGTAGPIKLASHVTRLEDTFFAMNGDIITQINLTEMLEQHRSSKAAVTDALYQVRDPSRFGVVQLDPARRIQRFVEKPSLKEAPSRMINAGIYTIEPSVLGMISPGRKVSLEREIFPILAKRGKLIGFPFRGNWFDIGNLSDYQRANFTLLQKLKHEPPKGSRLRKAISRSKLVPPLLIGTTSKVGNSSIVGPNALIGKQCLIGRGVRLASSILFDAVSIGDGSIISGAVVASNVSIGKRVKIEPGVTVSPNVTIADGVRIGTNAVIHPYKEITANISPRANIM